MSSTQPSDTKQDDEPIYFDEEEVILGWFINTIMNLQNAFGRRIDNMAELLEHDARTKYIPREYMFHGGTNFRYGLILSPHTIDEYSAMSADLINAQHWYGVSAKYVTPSDWSEAEIDYVFLFLSQRWADLAKDMMIIGEAVEGTLFTIRRLGRYDGYGFVEIERKDVGDLEFVEGDEDVLLRFP